MSSSASTPRRLGRPPKSEATNTRERLLDAALTLFSNKGFAGTSVREIAERTGIRDSAIYSHFSGKQAIFDALLSEVGLLDLSVLGLAPEQLADEAPADAIGKLVDKIMTAFDRPRARRFASVLIREGMIGRAGKGRSLADAIAEVQRQLHEPMRSWMRQGLVRDDFSAEQLVWELLAPVGNARFVYLHAQAGREDRRLGHELVRQHVRFFVSCVLTDGATEAGSNDPLTKE
ncbi:MULTISPECIES: TetR family transcriptional regulator [unclassified Actinopolyspora]|uniref:TetR/AcrR family transcriptional regulator n=1 Tax=Actinopolyspora TaxID=1849 RepID=UPI0013F60E20|nr:MULTISPECIES: TetR family transcriptional regulator [unclassified Actinopolyspora]NHD15985.1 TetR/AcrR family transcriptional regulator [Actinopolyspora sp. BKK2]NHE74801.1 TetR/AcrR family transcriptional regulator [Actinopolyspora sp. BKK1]